MKNLFRWMMGMTALSVLFFFTSVTETKAQPGGNISYQTFYNELSPYGDWIYDNDYGYVWSPRAGNDFRPYYTNGRWAMTDYGNTWISNYDWGWAPFHYGRWTYSPYYGWIWIPGSTWGPAWVTWRYGGGNYGWAPMGPGISINISFGNNYYTPYDWWTFVPCSNIYSGYYGNYWRGAGYNTTYINNTVIINNTYNNRYVYGPRRNEIEHVTGGRVNTYNLRDGRTAGRSSISGNAVNIYRPEVSNGRNNQKEAPRNFVRADKNRSIRNSTPALTGKAAMERNQREMKNVQIRNNTNAGTGTNRDAVQNANDRKVQQAARNDRRAINADNGQNNRTQSRVQADQNINARAQQEQQRNREIQMQQQRDQQRAQQTQLRNQQIQQQRDQQRAQQTQLRNQQIQQQRMQRDQQRAQQAERQRIQRPQQAPQREWRRPEPQRQPQMQRSQPQMQQQRSAPMQRSNGGFDRGGSRGGRR